MQNPCLFCRIVSGEIPAQKVLETDDTIAFLDIHPVHPGHVLVIPKAHHATLLDVPMEALASCMSTVQRAAKALIHVTNADGFNLKQNNGEAAGQAIHHLHFHLIPRFVNDGLKAWSGQALDKSEGENLVRRFREVLEGEI
ncbi:HIT family protein [Patescibacteria group bacterium]|nr:HIT family protein [Patescibacteria group bacterium]